MAIPAFPSFKPLELEDRTVIQQILWRYQPQVSELTFANLFIWRRQYRWQWSIEGEYLLLLGSKEGQDPYFFQPVGPAPRIDICFEILRWLRETRKIARPRLERTDVRLSRELGGLAPFEITPAREHFDYVYRSEDLIALKGSRYHSKRNHISRFLQSVTFQFVPISEENLALCAEFQDKWCEWRRCDEDLNLLGEWEAIKEALANYAALKVKGAALLIDGRVEAFTFGELLNAETAVVHIEKANPEMPGLYAMINQRFCEANWRETPFINREQDLGEDGLRKAKLSYHPNHLVEKFRVVLND
jgi:hypothetical protein